MAKKDKYDIKFGADSNGCYGGAVVLKKADGSFYPISFSTAPGTKVRIAKTEIRDFFEHRIESFLSEFPGSSVATWAEYNSVK